MRLRYLILLCLSTRLSAFTQSPEASRPELPKDPREVFARALPLYDFSSSNLKPWHLRATYQLYDDQGSVSTGGTYENWWASPEVYRSSWTRADATHTDWHTADGKHAYRSTGEALDFFESKLRSAFLSPLPDEHQLDPSHVRLEKQAVSPSGVKLYCIMLVPNMDSHGKAQVVPLGLFPTYCFDAHLPALRVGYSFGTLAMEFDSIAQFQGHYLAKRLEFFEGKRKILTATVDEVNGIAADDSALIPASDATIAKQDKVAVSAQIANGKLIKKELPIYPQDAKEAHVEGKVVLQATIGRDGAVHELQVVSTPWPSLAGSALWSVSHWRYQPYLLNGEPVEVETTINVIYQLGR